MKELEAVRQFFSVNYVYAFMVMVISMFISLALSAVGGVKGKVKIEGLSED